MIKGFRFTNQLANAEVDARIHQEFLNKNDGIFYGMELSNTNNSITISEGLCEIAGRPIAVIDNETVEVSTNELYCVLVLEIDLSKESTKDIFNQVSFKILTSSASYPSVTKQDINVYNGSDNLYQLEFARFRSGTNGITDFKDSRKFLNFDGIYKQVNEQSKEIIEQIRQELLNVEDGSAYLNKSSVSVLTGKVELQGAEDVNTQKQTTLQLDFPSGFNKDNCICIAFGGRIAENRGYSYGLGNQGSASMLLGNIAHIIQLGATSDTSKIFVSLMNPTTSKRIFYYKIVLMRIS